MSKMLYMRISTQTACSQRQMRERERDRQTDRQAGRQAGRQRQRDKAASSRLCRHILCVAHL